MQVRSLGQEDSLEEGMSTHSIVLAWRILWSEEPGGLQSIESQRVGHDESNLALPHLESFEQCLSHRKYLVKVSYVIHRSKFSRSFLGFFHLTNIY